MDSFEEVYGQLNVAQRKAVDATEGPVMVVAGPGTGKTQLLAVRVANILKQNSTLLPTNILCLTFTEAGQAAMQQRLVQIMGDAGAHVAVHTFHSFGAEIMGRYPQFFYSGLTYQPADPLTTHEILLEIFEQLPHSNPLAVKNLGEFVYLGSAKKLLAQLKKAALTPEELKQYARNGLDFIAHIEPGLLEVFDVPTFGSKTDIDKSDSLLDAAMGYKAKGLSVPGAVELSQVFIDTFSVANETSHMLGKTKPLNDWKKQWFTKDKTGKAVCKQRTTHEKILAFADIYKNYRKALDERRLFDFDDMIGRVVHEVENNKELAYEIQEQYQYFLVDEFQDTNAGQLRLLHALANHPVHEGRPNVMVVGDDDQAIFAFQGAELSNILHFEDSYKDVQLVVLSDNYRSSEEILLTSRAVIQQGVDRLETRRSISKELTAKATEAHQTRLERKLFSTQPEELFWLAQEIAAMIKDGHKPQEIAVICREHKHLEALLPYLAKHEIPVWYERQQDALHQPVVRELLCLVRTVDALSSGDYEAAEASLPELLAAPYWRLTGEQIWKVGVASERSYRSTGTHQTWLEVMLALPESDVLHKIAAFLLEAAKFAQTEPLETVLDGLIGNTEFALSEDTASEAEETQENLTTLVSPFKEYHFNARRLEDDPRTYNDALTALVALRNRVRDFNADKESKLHDLVYFVDLCESAGSVVTTKPVLGSQASSVQLVTAHGSKGLEYETVFLLSAMADVWDKAPRGDKLGLPPNMLHIAHPAQEDDNLRILFVAMTRAKSQLILSQYLYASTGGKAGKVLAPLEHPSVVATLAQPTEETKVVESIQDESALLEVSWHDKYYDLPAESLRVLLADKLASYRLSITHLNNFLDVTKGGPKEFLLGNLLRFPSAMSPSAAYGDAMHKVLQHLHSELIDTGKVPAMDALKTQFERLLAHKHLAKHDFQNYLLRGEKALEAFYADRKTTLNSAQKPEQDFYSQGVEAGKARLSGKLDLLEVKDNDVYVTDYKTGKALPDWSEARKSVYEKIKQHHYRQQLYFYKLLVDGSRDYGARGRHAKWGELVFVEPVDGHVQVLGLELDDSSELARLQKLIAVVWKHIQELDFPDVSDYEPTLAGIKQFEQDLLDGKV